MLNLRNSYPRELYSQNIHRINALSLGRGRGTKRKGLNNNFFNLTIILVLITGCLLQIISIFKLYLSYPTNIFIETKFQSYYKSLPAISFCTHIGDNSGQSTDHIFGHKNVSDYVMNMIIWAPGFGKWNVFPDNFTLNVIERLGKEYYCLTFNSLIKCELIILHNKKYAR